MRLRSLFLKYLGKEWLSWCEGFSRQHLSKWHSSHLHCVEFDIVFWCCHWIMRKSVNHWEMPLENGICPWQCFQTTRTITLEQTNVSRLRTIGSGNRRNADRITMKKVIRLQTYREKCSFRRIFWKYRKELSYRQCTWDAGIYGTVRRLMECGVCLRREET
jgi:hypothetical protein